MATEIEDHSVKNATASPRPTIIGVVTKSITGKNVMPA
jgi:hypothetical protein